MYTAKTKHLEIAGVRFWATHVNKSSKSSSMDKKAFYNFSQLSRAPSKWLTEWFQQITQSNMFHLDGKFDKPLWHMSMELVAVVVIMVLWWMWQFGTWSDSRVLVHSCCTCCISYCAFNICVHVGLCGLYLHVYYIWSEHATSNTFHQLQALFDNLSISVSEAARFCITAQAEINAVFRFPYGDESCWKQNTQVSS